jgi:hypothetical protein
MFIEKIFRRMIDAGGITHGPGNAYAGYYRSIPKDLTGLVKPHSNCQKHTKLTA